MQFETHQIPETLSPYIEAIFHIKNFMPDHSIERVVPTGHIFIIFELDGFTRKTFDNETLIPQAEYQKVWISGSHKNYLSISAHENSEMLVIQFKPFGAHPFLHFPLEKINNQVVQGEELLGDELINLRQELLEHETSAKKFTAAESWLMSRFDENKIPPKALLNFYESLAQAPAANYSQIVDDYPNTQKHLISQFKKYVGLTPKSSQRILRFNEILHKIHNKEMITWAQVAYQCGFSDQSYFIKEFKRFSGFNPEEFINQAFDQDEPNFFPLDRKG
ncbi:helix-turn-helix domain-containing protein [Ekhidna sp.]|uniref:helix-turn-helix domain-containing protein n=1 Tax=Ekhidna sp. TaxID=2608089 RepID=UPI003B598DBC